MVLYKVAARDGKYLLNGTRRDVVHIQDGVTYTFDISDIPNHPFYLSLTKDGVHSGGTPYKVARTTKTLTLKVTDKTPRQLYYYCAYHAGMGGSLQKV